MSPIAAPTTPLNLEALSANLWDLRSQAEAKLRCLTKLHQLLAEYATVENAAERARKRLEILEDLTNIVTISRSLRVVAEEALAAAEALP
jgi:hypothetical protein